MLKSYQNAKRKSFLGLDGPFTKPWTQTWETDQHQVGSMDVNMYHLPDKVVFSRWGKAAATRNIGATGNI